MRQMKDSTNPGAIPVSTALVAGYVPPSRFAWSAAEWTRFPASVQVRITPSAGTHGAGIHVLDVETGDATPAQVPGWVLASRGNGQEPTVYCNIAVWPSVVRACINAGVVMPQWWIAEWDGVQTLPALTMSGVTYRAIAKQYADPAHGSGGDWDSSIVADFWPGVDQGDDVSWTDNLTNPHDDTQIERAGDLLWEVDLWEQRNGAAIAALTAVVSGLASGIAGVTGDQIKQWIDDAVAQHLQITGTVTVTGVAGTTTTPS